MSRPRITIVGLGPGGVEHVTDETRRAIERSSHRFVRTARHPSAHLVDGAASFDEIYDSADTFDEVYEAIVEHLATVADEHGEILYAVPGSPLVLERTIRLLAEREDVDIEILPAMSFLDIAWSRLGIDPIEDSVRLVDGHDFARVAAGERGPLLVAHTHADWVLSDIKLAVDGAKGDEPVVILQSLGTPDERITNTTWSELDRTIEADHLTSIYIPRLATPVGAAYVRFHELTRTLRESCPWDIEQTHQSLVPHLLEETYEVVDAIAALGTGDPVSGESSARRSDDRADVDLIEELGDLLYQIEFHATIAEQEGRFTIADVADGIHDKLVRRHPHVFGDTIVDGTDEVLDNWEAIKRAEKGRTSVFDGIPRSMPSLSYSAKIGRKASKVGFDWPAVDGAFEKVDEEIAELREAAASDDHGHTAEELGDVLFAIVNVARHLDVDPELALRAAGDKFRRRFEGIEALARGRDLDLHTTELSTLDAMWDEVKAAERSG
ncbi:MAG: nucleoside triphosphate pyrophosphohydrolase [Acidimicrobiia bacterium]|nr:nucleoside triphosphate pyrophosphohydrolase [Acidimicrobiia bacterium]